MLYNPLILLVNLELYRPTLSGAPRNRIPYSSPPLEIAVARPKPPGIHAPNLPAAASARGVLRLARRGNETSTLRVLLYVHKPSAWTCLTLDELTTVEPAQVAA